MMNRIYKAIGVSIIICLLLIVLGVSIGLVIASPKHYPEKWLKAEGKISSFIEKITLPTKIAKLSWLPLDEKLIMPVYSVRVREIEDSWHSPRPDGRTHEGQDIFADRGIPVFSATKGIIIRMGFTDIGGNFVYVVGAGGGRYYYAHLLRIAEGLKAGREVTTDTVLGFVGNTGNAESTPPHLHFGFYLFGKAINPLPLLENR
jgi:murein DD-endopeptidase MepM/ murein hydrolase activator NlpD